MYQRSESETRLLKVIGARIQRARKAKFNGHPQSPSAYRALDMDSAQLRKIERGIHAPSILTLRRLVEVLEIDPSELFAPVRPGEYDDDEAANN